MKATRIATGIFGVVVLGTFVSTASAGPFISIDENGHGFLGGQPLQWMMTRDPGPGGLPFALSYQDGMHELGDLLIKESSGALSDVVRFNPDGMIVFYSEPEAPSPGQLSDLADTGFPMFFYPNTVILPEQGSEGNNWVDYIPLPGQPGYMEPSLPAVGYHIISDISQPATLGDLNWDTLVNNQDINPFVLALTDLPAWQAQYPEKDILAVGDINGDGFFNNQDINPFVALLTGGGAAVPEPATLSLLALGGLAVLRVRRK